METTTTIKIYKDHLKWWKLCCKVKNKNSQECFAELREAVKLKKQAIVYQSLPMPSDYKRKLEGKRLNKYRLKIKYTNNSSIL
jgi:hypothetical protein